MQLLYLFRLQDLDDAALVALGKLGKASLRMLDVSMCLCVRAIFSYHSGVTDLFMFPSHAHSHFYFTAHAPSLRRGITDAGLGMVADACPLLARLLVWGDTQLTGAFFHGHARAAVSAAVRDNGVELHIFGRPGDVMPAAVE